MPSSSTLDPPAARGHFPRTIWTQVLQAGAASTPSSLESFNRLCLAYWPPLQSWLVRHGATRHQADDIMQSFFEFMVDKKVLRRVSQARGRFRAFLLAALHNHWADLRDHDNAIKRGGGERMGSLDETDEDGKPIHEAVEIAAPDTEFDRDWALNLLRRVITRLESEYTAGGKADLFTHLQSFLYGDPDAMTHKQAADVLRISHEAVRIAGHRLRKRYQELIHLEIRDTVQSEADVADELQLLFAALRGRRG